MKILLILLLTYNLRAVLLTKHRHVLHSSRKEGKAYVRGNLINHPPGHKGSEQDFDHIIVVKNTKTKDDSLDSQPSDPSTFQPDKAVSPKENEFDHTIVVETKPLGDEFPKYEETISDHSEQPLHDAVKTSDDSILIQQDLHDSPKIGEEAFTDKAAQSFDDSEKPNDLTISDKAHEALQEAEKTLDDSATTTADKTHLALLDAVKTTEKTTPRKTDTPLRLVSEKEETLPTFETPVNHQKISPTHPAPTIRIVHSSSDLPSIFPDTVSESRDKETITKIQSSSSKSSSESKITKEASISRLEGISKGTGIINGFAVENSTICRSLYKRKDVNEISLKQVLEELFGEDKVPVEQASRGFINTERLHFANDAATITVSTCDEKGVFKVENLIALSTVMPVKWMELRHVKIKSLEFNYEEMLGRKEGTPWNRMSISGNGFTYLGATRQEAFIQFEKSMSNSNNDPVDSDMTLHIQYANEEYKDTIQASLFLGIFGQSLSSLYPEPPTMEISHLGLESLSFNRKPSDAYMIKGIVSESNQYTVYITGEVTGSNLLSSAKSLYIVCQNDFSILINNINCALIGTIESNSFDFNSLVNDISLSDVSKEVKLFRREKIPDVILFQSSRSDFDSVNILEVQEEINKYTVNTKQRKKDVGFSAAILSGTCFRYRISDIAEQFDSLNLTKDQDILVNMYPTIDSIKFFLPDIGPISISQIPNLITDFESDSTDINKLFENQEMEVGDIEVIKSDIGSGFKFVIDLNPSWSNDSKGFQFLTKIPFIKISQTPIKMMAEKNKKMELEGSGEETMLRSSATFNLGLRDNDASISGEMRIRNTAILSEQLKQWVKPDKKGTGRNMFQALQLLTLSNLHYTANAGVDRVIFSGSTLLGSVSDTTFQQIVYHNQEEITTATCIYSEKTEMAEFINAVYGKNFFAHSWLKANDIGIVLREEKSVSEISRFTRELCNVNVDEDISKDDPKGNNIIMFVNDLQLNECGNKEKLSEPCLFLKRVFKGAVPIKMSGQFNPKSLELEGYTSKEMELGPNIILRGLKNRKIESKNEKLLIKITLNDKIDQITLLGLLKFAGDTSKELLGKVVLAGDSIMLQIPESTSTDHLDIVRNDRLEFVQLVSSASSRKTLSATKPLDTLVMNAAMKIGNADADAAIVFDNKNLIKQYIDPATMAVKFYACKDNRDEIDISEILKAFGEGKLGVRGLLDNSTLQGLCVSYHEEKDKWVIEDLGLEVEPGLRLTATLLTNFGDEERMHGTRLKSEMRVDEGKSVFCVVLPPQNWGMRERIINGKSGKTKLYEPSMEMYFKQDSRSFGPELCYEFPFVGEHAFGYLTGYIKTIGVETDGEISIKSFGTEGVMDNYVFEYSGQLFSEVEGSLTLEAVYSGQDPSKIKFKVKVNILESVQKMLKTHVLEYTQERSSLAIRQVTKAKEYLSNFTKWKKEYDDQRIQLLTERQKHQSEFRRTKIERARSIQAFSKDCSHDCGYVRVPGWSLNEKCARGSNGRMLRCMSYVKDSHVASNVGCVASCEADRVRSLVEARELNTAARLSGGEVDKHQYCLDLLQDVIQLINIYIEKMTESVNKMEKITQSHRDLGTFTLENINDKIQLDRLDSEVLLDELDDPTCLPFNIDVKVTFNQHDDLVRSYTKVKRCFNGRFVKKLVEFVFEDMMKNDIEAMESYLETMDEKYAAFEKILKRNTKNAMSRKIKNAEEAFQSCISGDVIRKVTRRRSVVESTLSPFRSSLFTIFRDSTVKAFKHNSPWTVAKRRDAFEQMIRTQRKPILRNTIPADNEKKACSAARRAAIDYSDITNYVHKWIKEQRAARRTLSSVQKFIGDDVKRADIGLNLKNYSKDEVENMQYWMNKAKTGMSKWLESESERIERHNKDALPLLRKELEFVYTDGHRKTLRDFFTHRSTDGTKALKKANIEAPTNTIFPDLSQRLLTILESGRTLDDISVLIEDTLKRIAGLEKRTILCNV